MTDQPSVVTPMPINVGALKPAAFLRFLADEIEKREAAQEKCNAVIAILQFQDDDENQIAELRSQNMDDYDLALLVRAQHMLLNR